MSWRVAILRCTIEGEEVTVKYRRGADWVIPAGADDSAVDTIADLCCWRLPLRIFTPSADDPRLRRLLQTLDEKYAQDVANSQIYVRPVQSSGIH